MPAIMSTSGFATRPGTDVAPMWWIPPSSQAPRRSSSRSRSAWKRRGQSGSYGTTRISELGPDDLNDPAAVSLAVELEEHHALPGPEAELAVPHRNGLAGGPAQHRPAVRVPVPEVHVLGADVLGAAGPGVVRVVGLARHEPLEQVREVLEEAALELVHAHAARRVGGGDAGDPIDDPALPDRFAHLFRDVADGQTAGRSKLSLVLEDLHRTLTLLRGRPRECGQRLL